MAAPNDSVLKLDWAEQQFEALKYSTDVFSNSKPYAFRFQHKPEASQYALVARVTKTVPPDWGLIVGDIANNARSALDYIVDRLSTLPATSGERSSLGFPICDNSEEFSSRTGQPAKNPKPNKIKGVDPAWLPVFEEFQPYKGGGADDPLWILQKINNGDKHRAIRAVVGIGRFTSMSLGGAALGGIMGGRPNILRVVPGCTINFGEGMSIEVSASREITEQETEIATTTGPANMDLGLNPEVVPTVQFAVGQPGIEERPVVPTMRAILDRVKEVLGKF